MKRRIAFIINERAGTVGAQSIERRRPRIDAIANGGPIVLVRNGDDIAREVAQALASGCEGIVAGGGDGTLNAVASPLVGTSTVFGVLPLGTLNHFAQDAGLPLDLDAALDVIEHGLVDSVDVGEISGRHFLNNASLGLYVRVVRHRERQRSTLGRGKWPAFAWALWSSLRRFPFMTLHVSIDGHETQCRSPFLFIGNNRYEMSGFSIGRRASLQAGELSIYAAQRAGRGRLFVLAMHALLGRVDRADDFRMTAGQYLRVNSEHATLQVATDGEITRLETPLECRIHTRALKLYVPSKEP